MELHRHTINTLIIAFEALENMVPAPIKEEFGGGYVYRYKEKSFQQAVIQKLARTVTGLKSILVLHEHGLLQEQAALQRVLDELEEDIMFLTLPFLFDDMTELHQKFLDAFYEEEFDKPESAIESTQKRPMISRKKIRAYITRPRGPECNQQSSVKIHQTLSKTYSGYVHCASPQVMELYFGSPSKFQLNSDKESPFYNDHKEDLSNNVYRAVYSFAYASCMLGADELFSNLLTYADKLADVWNKPIYKGA
ncbi:hypothetical protein J8M20_23130 [Pseudoalteromonas luteoviolacea]|uniref:hypothetical protein n=1 Tax=Pseudoalteromonas luteoviolacea TaxID=43657 RepID=UPI001B37123E|nr:hypothetical protein [Pseudoalteromonas luteoviolacea]MBQ4814280.1 hypothetical protein [Pseudoalteromonas luteoviolacea]